MDHAKLLDVLTPLPLSQSILPRAVCFATSRPANHAICSFIDSSGYASGPIRRCLFSDYIIIGVMLKQHSCDGGFMPLFKIKSQCSLVVYGLYLSSAGQGFTVQIHNLIGGNRKH